jgi:hypothetical protein
VARRRFSPASIPLTWPHPSLGGSLTSACSLTCLVTLTRAESEVTSTPSSLMARGSPYRSTSSSVKSSNATALSFAMCDQMERPAVGASGSIMTGRGNPSVRRRIVMRRARCPCSVEWPFWPWSREARSGAFPALERPDLRAMNVQRALAGRRSTLTPKAAPGAQGRRSHVAKRCSSRSPAATASSSKSANL